MIFEGIFDELIESKKDFSQELVKRMNFLTTGKDQQGIIILFFNAETSKIKDFYRNYSDIYQFADKNDLKVAVSTQYQSSSIGVNLDYTYKNENGDMITSDIESAYFIDVDHYFFSKDDLKKSEKNKRKSNLEYNILTYKLQKLLFSKYISNCDFEQRVDELSNGSKKSIQRLNNSYKTRSNPMYADYCNTVVSRLIQRVGRLNRAWANVPKIKIVLSSDYIDLINYFSEHLYNYDEIEPTLPIIFKEVLSAAKAESEEFDFEEMTTKKHSPKKIIELIDVGFMTAIRNSRKSNMDQSSLEILSRSWEQIRSYSLAHDFHKPIIMPESVKSALPGYSGPDTFTIGEIALIEAPEGFDGENIWYIEDSDGSCRVFSKPPKENSKKLSYREIYEPIMLSHVCKKRFTNKGYHTSIHENNGYASGKILHPAFVQRILQGAIGEECVRALISHTNPRAATTTKLQHPNTMESWDFCVAQCNKVVIDAKYWSYITIDNKSKEPETIQHYIEMVKNLRKVYNKDVKYIVASLVQHNEEDQVYAYSIEQGPLSQFELHKADIIMIPGCLQKTGEQFEISMIFKSVFKQGNVIDQIITSNRIEDPKSA